MQLKYVFSETGTGLRRNVTMTLALVVTIFVSLTLVGMALLLNTQAKKAEDTWGGRLQVTVFMCNQDTRTPTCTAGGVTPAQKTAIRGALDTNPEVSSYYHRSKAQAFATWKKIYVSKDKSQQQIYSTVTEKDMQESYWVTLKDPKKYQGLESQVGTLGGVANVRDLRDVLRPIYYWMSALKWGAAGIALFLLVAAVMQVANSIRLAAYARRREIGIMRLVGASRLYIQLPFLFETLLAALVGVALSAGAIALFVRLVVYDRLRQNSQVMEWVTWVDAGSAIAGVAVLGVVLVTVPTLVMTRKYLRV